MEIKLFAWYYSLEKWNFRQFNIKGNDYRLITKIDYAYQKVFIKYVLRHPGYNKGKWKGVCGS